MTQSIKVKKGEEYLPKYRMDDLEQLRKRLPRGKPRLRVHAAMLRKEGKSYKKTGHIIAMYYRHTTHRCTWWTVCIGFCMSSDLISVQLFGSSHATCWIGSDLHEHDIS